MSYLQGHDIREVMVRIGIAVPQDGAVENLLAVAEGADELGLDSVWVLDRLLRPHAPVRFPGGPAVELPPSYTPGYDPLDTLAFLAGRTTRVQLGTSALLTLMQPPVTLARRLATVDRFSGGRLVAGLVRGWMAEEFAVTGSPVPPPPDAFDEHLAAMRAVWGPDPVTFTGTHFSIPAADIGPKPGRRIPLLVGYTNRAGLRRAARIGDGLLPYTNDPDALAADLAVFRAEVSATGRDPAGLDVVLRVDGHATAGLFAGDVAGWPADLATLADMGVTHVVVGLTGPPGERLDTMAELRRRAP